MKITGIVSNTKEEGWALEVTEAEYKRVMGMDNWRIEKAVRHSMPKEEIPWIIDMYSLMGRKEILYGNKVRIEIEFEKI